jgi:hypothetical protein
MSTKSHPSILNSPTPFFPSFQLKARKRPPRLKLNIFKILYPDQPKRATSISISSRAFQESCFVKRMEFGREVRARVNLSYRR